MSNIKQFVHSNLVLLILIFSASLIFQSCRVTLVPSHNASIKAQIEEVSKDIDRFYLMMTENTVNEDGGRPFDHFKEGYVEIEVELLAILNKNKVRPLNKHAVRISEITLEMWRKYKEEHREDDEIPDGLIEFNRLSMQNLLYALLVAEDALLLAEPPGE